MMMLAIIMIEGRYGGKLEVVSILVADDFRISNGQLLWFTLLDTLNFRIVSSHHSHTGSLDTHLTSNFLISIM